MNMKSEPARVIGLITAAVTSILALLVAFGVNLSDGQTVAILGVIAGISPLASAFLIREKVFSPETVEKITGQPLDPPKGI